MQENDDEDAPVAQNNGPKIKMNKIGRPKKGAAPAKTQAAAAGAKASEETWKQAEKIASTPGQFTEQDIEFMKKAI
jgi:hypothetical protein